MKRAPIVGFFAAMAIVHAIVASWTPVQGEAWFHWVWAGRHPDAGPLTWLASHATLSDAAGYVLARCPIVHAIVSPAVAIALVIGLFAVALRRLPRAGDTLAVALASALIWITQPHAGVTWFYTPSTAMHVYGACAAAWLIATYRCRWRIPPAALPVLALAAYGAGTSTRAIATLTVVVVALQLRDRRERWALGGFGVLLAATVVGYLTPPSFELFRVFRRGLDPNLFVLKLSIEDAGKVISFVALFALIELGRRQFGRAPLDDARRPDPRETAACAAMYVATSVWCLFGPKFYEATLFPATCVLVVAALPWLVWFAEQRAHRLALIGFAAAVHAIAWPLALVSYHWIGAEGAHRVEVLRAAPAGGVAVVEPYSEILATPFFFGEDFNTARLRQLVAIEVFGLHDIQVAPEYRRLEADPQIAVRLIAEGAGAVAPPPFWSTVPTVAREQFARWVERAHPTSARLEVTNVAFPRPVAIAWVDHDTVVNPRVLVSTLDEENQFTVKLYAPDVARFNEAWWVQDATATRAPYRNGSTRFRPTLPVRVAVVVCNPSACLLVDAFVPRF